MSSLTYSDKVPTVPGWYWQRGPLGVTIIKLPDASGLWPQGWRERRASVIEVNNWRGAAAKRALSNDAGWRVEYAGPIPQPTD